MFDKIKVLWYGLFGYLKEEATLRKFYWPFLFSILLSLFALFGDSWASVSFWTGIIVRYLGVADGAGTAVAISMVWAFGVFFLTGAVAAMTLDVLSNRTDKTNMHKPLYVATILSWITISGLGIYANINGLYFKAEESTEVVTQDQSLTYFDKIDQKIEGKNLQLNNLLSGKLGGYGWKDKSGTYHLNNSGKRFQRQLSKEITDLGAKQDTLYSKESQKVVMDQERYSGEVKTKQNTFTALSWIIYPLVLLLAFLQEHYTDKAMDHFFDYYPEDFQNQVRESEPQRAGFKRGAIATASTKERNELKLLRIELERLKGRLQSQETNTGHDPSSTKYRDKTTTVTKEVNGYLITCKTCGVEAVKKRKTAKYCSDKCRIEGYNLRQGNSKSRLKFNEYN